MNEGPKVPMISRDQRLFDEIQYKCQHCGCTLPVPKEIPCVIYCNLCQEPILWEYRTIQEEQLCQKQ